MNKYQHFDIYDYMSSVNVNLNLKNLSLKEIKALNFESLSKLIFFYSLFYFFLHFC